MNPTDEHSTLAAAPAFEVSAEVLATLTEIGEEVNASLDLDEVLARTAALIKRHIDYEIFGVLMFEGRRVVFEVSILHRISARVGGKICEFRWGRGLPARRRQRGIRCESLTR